MQESPNDQRGNDINRSTRTRTKRFANGLSPLRRRDYALYFFGNGCSSLGSQAEIVATAWILYQLTDSPLLLGLNGLFHGLPIFVLVPLAGTVADRHPPRRILIAAQGLAVLNSAALGLLVVMGWVQPWHIYLQSLLQASVATFDVTARQTLFPRLTPRAELDRAVTLNFTMSRIAMFSGPWIGGTLIAKFGSAMPFFFNAASFLLMLLAMFCIREPLADKALGTHRSVRLDIAQGWAFIRQSQVISSILLFAALWGLLSHNAAVLTIFARDVLKVGPQELGLLLSFAAVGQLTGSLFLVFYGDVQRKGYLFFGTGAIYALAMIVFAFSRDFWLSAEMLVIAGVAIAAFSATRHTILQRASPDELRGRVMGTHLMVTRGASPLSQTLTGLMVSLFGPTGALVAASVTLGCVTVAVAILSSALRRFVDAGEATQ